MMVPLLYDIERRKTKVWAVLGIVKRPMLISYATPPTVQEIKVLGGRLLKPGDVDTAFTADWTETNYFATAEVYVTRLLNRKEFARHCDRYNSYQAMVGALE